MATMLRSAILAVVGSALLAPAAPAARPNIVLIVADDLGFSDLGCYGGEVILTPHLDALAKEGLRFTQFYSAGRGCPTRASLLTGLYAHQTGVGHMMIDFHLPGYRGNLNRQCVTIAEVLGAAGYQTLMVGKWHLSRHVGPKGPTLNWPLQRGFDHFYGTIHGAGSYFDPVTLTRENEFIGATGDFYYTDVIAQQAGAMLDAAARSEAPLFLYVAFTAPHWPLQARSRDVDRYRGKFSRGWDELRLKRYQNLLAWGIIKRSSQLTPRDPRVLAWLHAPYRQWHQRRMEVYAAQVDAMDRAVGRIVEKLKQVDRYENSLLLFLSDNGAAAEEILPDWKGLHIPRTTRDNLAVVVGNDPQQMPGPEETYQSYGVPWANLSNTPFRLYKGSTHEGGIAVPLIVRWPAVVQSTGGLTREIAHVVDVMATCCDAAGIQYPEILAGYRRTPTEGRSLLPVFQGQSRPLRPYFFEHEGNRAVRYGKWKLVSEFPGKWELYDMTTDRTELNDLAPRQPDIVEKMSRLYDQWAARVGVVPWRSGR